MSISSRSKASTGRVRRFIAAAVCPSCGENDSLYLTDKTDDKMACVSCDYTAHREETEKQSSVASKSTEVRTQVLLILDKKKTS